MKYFLIAIFLSFGGCAFAQVQDSVVQKPRIDAVWIDPLQSWAREIRLYVDTNGEGFIQGFVFGFVHPNENLSDQLRTKHTASQLKFTNYGFSVGVHPDFNDRDKLSFFFLARYTWSNNVRVDRVSHYTYEPHTGLVNIDQREASLNAHGELGFTADTWNIKHKFFIGLGFKIAYRYTLYNYYDDSSYGYKIINKRDLEDDDSWARVFLDNGFFMLPTVHVGYRIGYDFRE